jgi:hypothetical protein
MVYPSGQDNIEKLEEFLAPISFATETLTSGTGAQINAAGPSTLYCDVALGAAGTVKVDLSPDGTTFTNIIPATAANAASSQKLTIRVPTGYYVKITLSVATLSSAIAVLD